MSCSGGKTKLKRLLSFFTAAVLAAGILITAFAEEKEVLLGDVDENGYLSSSDARIALRFSVGLEEKSENLVRICDVNRDKNVTSADARIILRASVGLEDLKGEKVSISIEEAHTEKDSGIFDYKLPQEVRIDGGEDTFSFTVYGYGHGVGLSQWGAVIMAEAGYDYKEILSHYYENSEIVSDASYPETVTYNGEEYPTTEIVARITAQEIGGIADDEDAIKAQAVAIYTLFKYYNFSGNTNGVGVALSSYDNCSLKVKTAVSSVFGQYIALSSSKEKNPVLAVYSAFPAGKSVDCKYAWGGGSYPVSVPSPFEYKFSGQTYVYRYTANGVQQEIADSDGNIVFIRNSSGRVVKDTRKTKQSEYFAVVYIYPSELIKEKILAYDETIILSENPEEWFDIISHNASIDENRGYVKNIRVGDLTLSGVGKLSSALKLNFRSGCYTVKYNKASEGDIDG